MISLFSLFFTCLVKLVIGENAVYIVRFVHSSPVLLRYLFRHSFQKHGDLYQMVMPLKPADRRSEHKYPFNGSIPRSTSFQDQR
ncbi:uncharacterized protein BJ212DRAFT_1331884 [Suillus subaureus]|uniref:Secreted protein n=1 Tax=Suillus subaureus TaxID=48587 RepID=A0A9P7EHC2_9AGAM|nr:uncharacterized protein BJ212DRAFT_1331884 [Suillus subaureus]KAG1821534.1 hypothetical protein BJ212DRAFT_1331884 [Suillus subaureus]